MYNSQNFYINSQQKLQRAIDLIKQAKIVALDTEFTRETTYYPILSIIQIAVKNSDGVKESFIIDCLCDIDLSDFLAIIADPKITKILHSSAQDLQIFYQLSNQVPQAVADTQIMANFCELGFNLGYSNLVESLFGNKLDKKQQRSNWQIRPLSQKQIEYALLDVFFLEEIYQKFFEIIAQKNHLNWFFEEMKNFINKNLFKSDESLNKHFSFRGKCDAEIIKIKNLILWREVWAKKTNVPRQHFIRDETLERIAAGKEIKQNFSAEINAEISQILGKKDLEFTEISPEEKDAPMTAKQKYLLSESKSLIAKIAKTQNFQEQFLITNSDLKKIICDKKYFDKIITGWRKQMFGEELKQLIF